MISSEVNNSSYSNHRYEQQQVYMDYLENHINGVKKAYQKYFVSLLNPESPLYSKGINIALFTRQELCDAIRNIQDAIDHHDDSKYSDYEFEPYRQHWDPTEEEKAADQDIKDEIEERYQDAWVHHYTNNDHHPMFWYNSETKQMEDMPLPAIVHMICDWESFENRDRSTIDWWNTKAVEERKYMTEKTIAIVDALLKIIHPEYKAIDNPNTDNLNQYIRDEYTDNKS